MTIITVQFNYADDMHMPDYEKLLRVFEASVHRHAPEVRFVAIRIEAPANEIPGKALNFWYNTVKLDEWIKAMEQIDDNIIFADCDMLMMRGLPPIFDDDFDVAFTERTEDRARKDKLSIQYWGDRPIRRMPMNGGIMLAKPTVAARDFFRQLAEVNRHLYFHESEHMKWNVKYAGMNQAAFGCLYETGTFDAKVVPLPCRVWNAVDTDWHAVNQQTVFAHIKSKLRRLVLSDHIPFGKYKPVMDAWYEEARLCGIPTFTPATR